MEEGEQQSIVEQVSKSIFSKVNERNKKARAAGTGQDGSTSPLGGDWLDLSAESLKREYKAFYNNVMGFIHAVSWEKELWLQAMIAGYIALFFIIILTRKSINIQAAIFCSMAGMIFASEHLNRYGHNNWQTFSTQDYFDKNGIFMSVVYAGPLVILMMFQVMVLIVQTSYMLVDVKKKELKHNKNKAVDKESKKVNDKPKSE